MNKVILISSLICILIWGCKKGDSPVTAPIPAKPVVKISSLQNNGTVTDTVSIVAQATDDKGIVKVEIYIDGKTDSSKTLIVPPYKYLWDVKDLSDGSTHIVYAKVYDADNNIESSEVLNVTVRRFQPDNLSLKMNSDTAAVLAWSDNCKFETGFEIEKGILSANGQATFSLVKTTDANVTQAVIEGNYSKDTTYVFRVRAVSQNGKSLYSNEAAANISMYAPSNLKVANADANSVSLAWSSNSSFPTRYEVEQSTNGGQYLSIGNTASISISVTGLALTQNDYSFRVRAVTKYNSSAYSNEAVPYLTVYAPSNLKILNADADKINLTWISNNNYSTLYEVEQSDNGGQFFSIGTTTANSISVGGISLTQNDYSFRVRAKVRNNTSGYSNIVSAPKVSLEAFGPVTIYETIGTTASQPAGLILSGGYASGIGLSAPDRGKVDLFFNSNGYIVTSADYASGLTKQTFFCIGSSSTLTDAVDSPVKEASWAKSFRDTETNYVFVLDNDGHYSKLQIVSRGGGTPGAPAYIVIKWIYNKIAGSRIF